jgi:hypothetical protein
MKTISVSHAGVTATVYFLGPNEAIGMHQHNVEHTTTVLMGSTRVLVPSSGVFIMKAGDTRVLLAEFDHDITAGEHGAVVMNLIAGSYLVSSAEPSTHGGVAMDDGTVTPHEAA